MRRKRGAAAPAAAPAPRRRLLTRRGHEEGAGGRGAAAEAPASGGEGAWLAAARKARARGARRVPEACRGRAAATADGLYRVRARTGRPVREDAPLTKLSQQDLLHMAFDDEDQEDFAQQRSEELAPERPPEQPDVLGWGSWTRRRAPHRDRRRSARRHLLPLYRRQAQCEPARHPEPETAKKAGLLKVAQVPYPFTSRSEYERYMARPVGDDWNAAGGSQLTRPAVSVRAAQLSSRSARAVGRRRGWLRLVTSQGSPYPSRSPRAHPSGWTRTQGLSHRDSHAPFFWDDPRQDVELATGSSFTTSRKSSGERDALAHQAEQSWSGERELRPAQTALDNNSSERN